jgi:hypothetical protein
VFQGSFNLNAAAAVTAYLALVPCRAELASTHGRSTLTLKSVFNLILPPARSLKTQCYVFCRRACYASSPLLMTLNSF